MDMLHTIAPNLDGPASMRAAVAVAVAVVAVGEVDCEAVATANVGDITKGVIKQYQ